MAYWLFQNNPKYYRILDAIRECEQMPWLVTRYQDKIAVGDGVLVWVAGKAAGIYAVAQVSSAPQIREEMVDKDYWIDATRAKDKPYVTIKFLRKLLGQPLRRRELKHDSILKNLLVIRAPNSTNFKVTDQEWQRVYDLKG